MIMTDLPDTQTRSFFFPPTIHLVESLVFKNVPNFICIADGGHWCLLIKILMIAFSICRETIPMRDKEGLQDYR